MNRPMRKYDVAIVGGGPSGLSAALVLGRACRRVLVCDSGSLRNAPSAAVHSLFSRDGIKPAELLRIGRSSSSLMVLSSTKVVSRPLGRSPGDSR
ncbi:MAG: FAD-dependent monooxygenase [Thermodesulfobacteriota bacterium]